MNWDKSRESGSKRRQDQREVGQLTDDDLQVIGENAIN